MSIADVTENAILNLIFRATAWANYADNAASSPETSIAVALHTADPCPVGNETGTMATSEANYTSYARVPVLRSTGWTVSSAGSTNPAAQIDFPAGTGGSGTVQNWSTGKNSGGAAPILFSGTVTPPIVTGNAITPHLTTATAITLD